MSISTTPRFSPRSIWFAVACLLASTVFPTISASQSLSNKIDEYLSRHHQFRLFNGAVLVAQHGDVVFEKGYGYANMDWDIPNSPGTRFRIASTTKQFTAALVLSLVQDGLVDLDDRISEHLADYPAVGGEHVRIRHLLSHTSGIPNYTSFAGFMDYDVRDPYTPAELLGLLADRELEFEPGSRWSYSNSNYIVLGAVVESVTEQTYSAALRERILDPAGLYDTGYDEYDDVVERRATGYQQTPVGWQRAPYLDTSVPYAAGMLYSTVRDLYKWDQTLYRTDSFLTGETKQQLFSPQADLPDELPAEARLPAHYGFGWFVGDVGFGSDTVRVIEHGGSIFGFRTGFWRMPEDSSTVILLANAAGTDVRSIGHDLISMLHGGDPPLPKRPVSQVMHWLIRTKGLEEASVRYDSLRALDEPAFDMRESELNRLGYFYLEEGDAELAVAVLKMNAESFPESPNVYDSLGEAYLAAGDTARAVENYRTVLDLNPNARNAPEVLKQLESK